MVFNVDKVLKLSQKFSSLRHFVTDIEDMDEQTDVVKVITIHKSKGLEFKYVFCPCWNEDDLPLKFCKGEDEIEEERRVAFVALTRAKEEVYITTSEKNAYNYKKQESRFISELQYESYWLT